LVEAKKEEEKEEEKEKETRFVFARQNDDSYMRRGKEIAVLKRARYVTSTSSSFCYRIIEHSSEPFLHRFSQ
jgi:hypothetical protein